MEQKYIVAVDGSDAGLRAVNEAVETVQNENTETTLELLHVLSHKVTRNGNEMVIEQPDASEDVGQGVLDKARELVPDTVSCETEIIHGKPADSIVEYAKEIEASKVFIGHRKKDAYNGVKSVAKKVISNAPCSVIVVNGVHQNTPRASANTNTSVKTND